VNGEKGAVTVALSAVVAILIAASLAVAAVGSLYAARTQAQAAADAGALAAAAATYPPVGWDAPQVMARRAVAANGARLLSCQCPRDATLRARVVVVTAAIEADVPIFGTLTIRGAGRAEFDPALWLGR
jgi:secretion/DNA translocation related TadE-like protein